MLTLEDIENPRSIIAWWNERQNEKTPYLYESVLDLSYSDTEEIEMLYGEDEPVEVLTATTDDVKATKLANIGFETDTQRVIPFKNYKSMNEKRRNELNRALTNNNDPAKVKAISQTQYKDVASLISKAKYTREKMFLQALTTGTIKVVSNNLLFERDFKMPDEHKVSVTTPWGTMESAPLEDIQEQIDKIADDNGTEIRYAIMNSRTFNKIVKSGEIINSLALDKTNNNIAISRTKVKELFTDTLNGVQPLIYNKGVGKERFIPDDVVVLVPDGSLGRLSWTDTNEDLGLVGDPSYQLSRTSDGITMYTKRIDDPVATMTYVSQKFLPAFDKVRNVMVMNVGATKASSPEDVKATPTSDGAKVTAKASKSSK